MSYRRSRTDRRRTRKLTGSKKRPTFERLEDRRLLAITIDNFDSSPGTCDSCQIAQSPVPVPNPGGIAESSSLISSATFENDPLRNERDLFADADLGSEDDVKLQTAGVDSNGEFTLPLNELAFSVGVATDGALIAAWDGTDGDPTITDTDGLMNLDLTESGLNDRFEFNAAADLAGGFAIFRVYSGDGLSFTEARVEIPMSGDGTIPAGQAPIPVLFFADPNDPNIASFDDPNFDFSNVGAIEFEIDKSVGLRIDGRIDNVAVTNDPMPDIQIIKLAGTALDGDVFTINSPQMVTYTYLVTNTGNTFLDDITIVDDRGTVDMSDDVTIPVPGILAPDDTTDVMMAFMVSGDLTNIADVTGNPTDDQGNDLPGLVDPTDSDDAIVDLVQPQMPDIQIIKLAGTAPDGGVFTINSPQMVTYTYLVTNTGTTFLDDITIVDDRGTVDLSDDVTIPVPGILAPSATQQVMSAFMVSGDLTNIADVTGNPTDASGNDLPGLVDPTDSDDAVVELLTQLAGLGDFVWDDLNANGIQDAGEPGISNATVNLIDPNTGNVIDQTTTNGAGFYQFTELDPGDYKVMFVLPNGFTQVSLFQVGGNPAFDSDADPNFGLMSDVVTLAPGEFNPTLDAGFFNLASLGDFVWEDLNGNGIQDVNEPGVPGVTVTLTGTDGAGNPVVLVMTTNQNGLYLFDNLVPGDYKVTFSDLPPGFVFTAPNQGGNDFFDSDADPNNGMTQVVSLDSGEQNLTLDAGIIQQDQPPAKIKGKVFVDKHKDGHFNKYWDKELKGVEIRLSLQSDPDNVIETVFTDEWGRYEFNNLQPGVAYKITQIQPHEFKDGPNKPGWSINEANVGVVEFQKDVVDDMFTNIVLESGECAEGFDFIEHFFSKRDHTSSTTNLFGSVWNLFDSVWSSFGSIGQSSSGGHSVSSGSSSSGSSSSSYLSSGSSSSGSSSIGSSSSGSSSSGSSSSGYSSGGTSSSGTSSSGHNSLWSSFGSSWGSSSFAKKSGGWSGFSRW